MLKSNLGKVQQHGSRADSIVKNMLMHSRENSGERRSADINAIVDDSLNLGILRCTIGENGLAGHSAPVVRSGRRRDRRVSAGYHARDPEPDIEQPVRYP